MPRNLRGKKLEISCRNFVSVEKWEPSVFVMVPTWTGKMGKLFPVREKLGNF